MPTVIEALLVTLGLDASKFTEQQRKVVDKLRETGKEAETTGKRVQKHGSTIADGFSAATRPVQTLHQHMRDLAGQASRTGAAISGAGVDGAGAMLGLGAAAAVAGAAVLAVQKLVRATMRDAGATGALGRTAANTGVRTRTLSTWEIAAKNAVGADPAAVGGTMLGLSQTLQNLRYGIVGAAIPALGMQGISAFGANGPKSVPEIYAEIAARMQGMSKPAAYRWGTNIGLDPGTINFLEQGPAGVSSALAIARKTAETGAQAAAAQKLTTAMNKLSAAEEALKRTAEMFVTPALIALDHGLTSLAGWIAKLLGGKTPADTANPSLGGGGPNTPAMRAAQKAWAAAHPGAAAAQSAMMKQFEAAGYTPQAAAAMTASAMAESSMNPHPAVDPKNPHYGLFQWSASRRAAILAATGIDVATAGQSQQVRAALWELSHGYKGVRDRMNHEGAAAAGRDATLGFERPGEVNGLSAAQEADRRGLLASRILGHHPTGASLGAVLARLRAAQHTTNTNNHVHMPITVHAKSADARGIGREVGGAVRQALLVMQANTGLA